jgi:DNA/RNA endonuclease G (NUC1)
LPGIGGTPGKELSSPAGPVGRKSSIGKKEKIAVPAKNWKVIVVRDRQGRCCRVLHQTLKRDRRDDAQLGQRPGQGVEKLPEYL